MEQQRLITITGGTSGCRPAQPPAKGETATRLFVGHPDGSLVEIIINDGGTLVGEQFASVVKAFVTLRRRLEDRVAELERECENRQQVQDRYRQTADNLSAKAEHWEALAREAGARAVELEARMSRLRETLNLTRGDEARKSVLLSAAAKIERLASELQASRARIVELEQTVGEMTLDHEMECKMLRDELRAAKEKCSTLKDGLVGVARITLRSGQ